MILLNIFYIIFMILLMLISVAFLTLLERSILSYIQNRSGPMKLGFLGYMQPFSDAIKLFKKELIILEMSNKIFFYLAPMLMIFITMFSWLIYPWIFNIYMMKYGILFIISCLMLNIFPLIYTGWSSGCHYSLLGSIRAVAQVISYEVSFILLLLNLILLVEDFNLKEFSLYQDFMMFIIYIHPIFIMYFISILAELNRTPFDLVESESELVSGFNTEYFSSLFALIFMSEYSMILLMSILTIILFTGILMENYFFYFFFFLIVYIILILRGVLPRIRYDQLMMMCWKMFLPLSLSHLLFILSLKMIMMN